MLATIRDDTWNVLNMQHIINPKFEKMGLIRHPRGAINRLKYPPTSWLKVATTLEKPPTPTNTDEMVSLNWNMALLKILAWAGVVS